VFTDYIELSVGGNAVGRPGPRAAPLTTTARRSTTSSSSKVVTRGWRSSSPARSSRHADLFPRQCWLGLGPGSPSSPAPRLRSYPQPASGAPSTRWSYPSLSASHGRLKLKVRARRPFRLARGRDQPRRQPAAGCTCSKAAALLRTPPLPDDQALIGEPSDIRERRQIRGLRLRRTTSTSWPRASGSSSSTGEVVRTRNPLAQSLSCPTQRPTAYVGSVLADLTRARPRARAALVPALPGCPPRG